MSADLLPHLTKGDSDGHAGGPGRRCLIALTLQAEATTDRALSEARQNISNPWPYLEIKTVLHASMTNESWNVQMDNHETAKQKLALLLRQ